MHLFGLCIMYFTCNCVCNVFVERVLDLVCGCCSFSIECDCVFACECVFLLEIPYITVFMVLFLYFQCP